MENKSKETCKHDFESNPESAYCANGCGKYEPDYIIETLKKELFELNLSYQALQSGMQLEQLKSALESANAEYAAVAEKLLNMAIEHKKLADENTKLAWYKEQWQSIAGKANLKHLVDENEILKNQVAVLSYKSPSNLMIENAKLSEANTQLRAALEFYADISNHENANEAFRAINFDNGKIAREALEKLK